MNASTTQHVVVVGAGISGLSLAFRLQQLAPAVETLDALLADGHAGTFDFAFIDADKSNYDHYYERALKLLRKGGLLVFDNMLWYGKVADLSVMDADTVALRALNAKLHHDERVFASLIGVGDGVNLAIKQSD